ncbi:MAG TPA: hypothetical protein VGO89_19470 [Streptomyces sp.]|nr:hypothetical protein [Streptomyces sp.]
MADRCKVQLPAPDDEYGRPSTDGLLQGSGTRIRPLHRSGIAWAVSGDHALYRHGAVKDFVRDGCGVPFGQQPQHCPEGETIMSSDADNWLIVRPRLLTAVGVLCIVAGMYRCVQRDWSANDETLDGAEALTGGVLLVIVAISVSRAKRRTARARQSQSGARNMNES